MDQPTDPQPERPPSPASTGSGDINYPAWAMLGGGFLILIGIFLNWFTVSASVAGFSASVSETGTGDWTGIVARPAPPSSVTPRSWRSGPAGPPS